MVLTSATYKKKVHLSKISVVIGTGRIHFRVTVFISLADMSDI
jgi:hypothetical protein